MNRYEKFIRLGIIYSLGQLLEKGLTFFLIPIYTAFLSTTDYGVIGLMTVTAGLVVSIFLSPIINGFNRHYYSPDFKRLQGDLVFNSFLYLIIKSALLAIFFNYLSNFLAKIILGNTSLTDVIKLYAMIIFFSSITVFCLNLVRMQERAKTYIFISASSLLFSAGLIIYLLVVAKLGFYSVIYGNLFGVIYTSLVLVPVLVKSCKFRFNPFVLIGPLKYGYPLILTGVSIFLINAGDRYVLRLYSALSRVGVYSFCYSFAGVINIVLAQPLKYAINPIVYKQEENEEYLKKFLRNSANYFYFISCFACLALSLHGKEVFHLMVRNKDFLIGWSIVPILAFSYVQHALGTILGKGPVMAKKPFHISGMVGIACTVNLGLNFLLIPYYGIMGAAFATLVSYVVWNTQKMYYSAKFYDLHFDIERLGHITIIGVSLYLLSLLLATGPNIWVNLSTKTLILIAYPVIFIITGFFSKKEKEYVKKLFYEIRANGILNTVKHLRFEAEETGEGVRDII
ncbi:MAG: lipopolysaccharide biosynthesis protein [Candidatus Hodarchaeota archaeon]